MKIWVIWEQNDDYIGNMRAFKTEREVEDFVSLQEHSWDYVIRESELIE